MGSCMYRRHSGIYVVRLAVPKRLRGELGRTEIHVSTELRELPAARLAALRILLGLRQKFMDLDVLQLVQGSPLLDGEGLVSVETASHQSGLSRANLCQLLRERGARVYVTPSPLSGRYVDNLSEEVDRDPATGELEWVVGREPGVRMTSFSQTCWLHESSDALVALGEFGTFDCSLLRPSTASEAAFLLDQPLTLDTKRAYARKSDVEAVRARLVMRVTPTQMAAAKRNQERFERSEARSPDDMLFSQLLETYLQEQKDNIRPEQIARMKTEGRYFLSLVGDLPLREIDRKTVLSKFKNGLLKLPNDMRKAKKLCGSDAVADLIAVADSSKLPRKSMATVDRHILKVSEIFVYGCAHLQVSNNPVRGLVRKNKAMAKKSNDNRDAFTSETLTKIFTAPWFITGSAPNAQFRSHYYWLPLLGLFTGARISELAQLYLHDIKLLDGQGWVFDFNLNEPDKVAPHTQELDGDQSINILSLEQVASKSLKNVNANRVVSVHSRLIELGLIDYVEVLRSAGYQRLFPEILQNSSKGRYGVAPAKWFNDSFLKNRLGLDRDGRTTFHSFRHTVVSALDHLKVRETDVAQVAGHARGVTTSFLVYGKDKDVSATIELLKFPETDGVAPFDVKSGLQSVKRALLLKKSIKRSVKPKD